MQLVRRTKKQGDFRGLLLLLLMTFCCISVRTSCESLDGGSNHHPKTALITHGQKFQHCGGEFNDTRGYFHTPNFPNPFPVPIFCKWEIQAPPEGHHIVVYFTQLYLRKGLMATEYLYKSNHWSSTNQEKLVGKISADNKPTYLQSEYPFLKIRLDLFDLTNANIRVLDNLMDVYGFNATYEILPKKEVKLNHCTVDRCSYNGRCFVSADYKTFTCHCFPNFTGEKCQYGLECNPPIGINVCKNGGNCSYVGSSRFLCHCPYGYNGSHCEQRQIEEIKGLTRFHGSLKLQNASYIPSKTDSIAVKDGKKALIKKQLEAVISSKVQNVKNLTILDFKDGGLVDIHFFAYENQSKNAREIWTKCVYMSKFGSIGVSNNHLVFEQEPGLSIQSLRMHQGDFVIVGNEMRLTCVTYGSSEVQFSWFKGRVPVNHNFTRTNWNTILPKSLDDKRTAIFTVGYVEEAHAGTYTCRVTDWGESQERSLTVKVVSSPRVTVTPRTMTVERGSSVSIVCLASMPYPIKVGFIWTKNDKVHVSSDQELVEDIFPSGSRLKISSAETSFTYACVVSGATITTQAESRITVINSNVIGVCGSEDKYNIRWSVTALNTEDIKPCPNGFRGEATRQCVNLNSKTVWEEPDFSRCLSLAVLDQQFKFDNLKLGFMLTTPLDILVNLSNYLKSRDDLVIYPGEGAPIIKLIIDVLNYQKVINSLKFNETLKNVFFDIISRLLMSKKAINKELQVLSLIRLIQETSFLMVRDETNFTDTIKRKGFETSLYKKPAVFSEKYHLFNGTTENVVVRLRTNYTRGSSNAIAVIWYQDLSRFLPKRTSTKIISGYYEVDVESELNSNIVTVAYSPKENLLTNSQNYVQITFNKVQTASRVDWNISCGYTNLTSSNRIVWNLDDCTLVFSYNSTICRCNSFGTYAVLLTSLLNKNPEVATAALDTVVSVGCLVGALFVLITLFGLIICWRVSFRGFIVMKVNVCIGLFGAMMTILIPSQFPIPNTYYPYVSTLVEFFLLEPLTMHVCLELFLYLELANVRHIRNAIAKITLLGWGIPVLVTGATVVVQAQEGFNFERWWMQVGDIYFFGFTISAVILFGLYVLLYLVVNLELRQSMTIGSPQQITIAKRMGLLRRSFLLQLAIAAFAFMSVIRGNDISIYYRYLFAAIVGFTGFLTFLLYTVQSESPGCVCFAKENVSSIKSSAEMSTRSTTTTSSLPKTQEDHLHPHLYLHHHHHHHIQPTLQDFRMSAVLGEEEEDPAREELLNTIRYNSAVLSSANNYVNDEHVTFKKLMGLVDYEGSPKKYPIANDLIQPPQAFIRFQRNLDVLPLPLPDVSCHIDGELRKDRRDTVV